MWNAFEINFFRKGLLKYFLSKNSTCIRVNPGMKTIMLNLRNLCTAGYDFITICKILNTIWGKKLKIKGQGELLTWAFSLTKKFWLRILKKNRSMHVQP
jgi:hypothetical protein